MLDLTGSVWHAGRVGSAFAAELGTMQVSEQVDSLRVLGSDPVNYLVAPRVLACMLAGPALNIFCFVIGEPPCSAMTTPADACMALLHCTVPGSQ